MRTIDEMVTVGKGKLDRKAADMSTNWSAAKERMKTGFGATPFNARIKASYNREIDAATHRVDNEKWARNWRAKMM